MPADLITVLLGLKERSEVQTGPDLLTSELTVFIHILVIELTSCFRYPVCIGFQLRFSRVDRRLGKEPVAGRNVPLLTDTVEVLVETVGHDNMHANHVVGGLEAAGGDVSL